MPSSRRRRGQIPGVVDSSEESRCREGVAARFAGIPDVHYGEDSHWVSGDRGVSEWTLTGTTSDGEQLHLHGCDLWTFRDGLIVRKDSYWKLVGE